MANDTGQSQLGRGILWTASAWNTSCGDGRCRIHRRTIAGLVVEAEIARTCETVVEILVNAVEWSDSDVIAPFAPEQDEAV